MAQLPRLLAGATCRSGLPDLCKIDFRILGDDGDEITDPLISLAIDGPSIRYGAAAKTSCAVHSLSGNAESAVARGVPDKIGC